MRIGKIASSAEYRMDEQFQKCQFLEPNFDFPHRNKFRNFLIFQFGQFQKLQIWKLQKNFNSGNSKKLQFGKFFKLWIWKIRNIYNFLNSKNLQFLIFETFAI